MDGIFIDFGLGVWLIILQPLLEKDIFRTPGGKVGSLHVKSVSEKR